MSQKWRKIRLFSLIILALSCLALLLTAPTLAQEKTSTSKETAGPAELEKSPPAPAMVPSPEKEALETPKARKAMSPRPQEERLQQKKVTDTVGGQEIRAKEKAEEND